MDRNLKVFAGIVLAAGLAACKGDPTTVLEGTGPQAIISSFSFVSLAVGDSLKITTQTRDAGNNPLADTATVVSADGTIATVSDAPVKPLLAKGVYVKGIKKGTTTLTASAGSASATITVVVN